MIVEAFTSYALEQRPTVVRLYEAIFTEPPYGEGPDDFSEFAASWRARTKQPGFRLVIAYDPEPVGMAFGRPLPEDTHWWDGMLAPVPADVVKEWPGRSFGINEIAVLPSHRRRGIGKAMHDRLLRRAPAERAVLLVRPEAAAAQAAYTKWGYRKAGPIRPYEDAPVYDSMVLPLSGRKAD